MKSICLIGIAMCLAYVVSGGPVVKISGQDSDDVNDFLPIALEAQELPVEKIENVQMNIGKMLDRSIGRYSLDDLVHGFHESVNHKLKPILDKLGHFRLSELIKHLKNKPILSHVVGDERPTTIEVVVHKPNGHHETIFSIPHKKKFLHKFHKPEHHEENEEEQEEEHVEEGHETEEELKPVIDYASQVYTTSYKKPVVVDHHGRGVIDVADLSLEDIEDAIFKSLSRNRRDVIHYSEEFEGAPEEEGGQTHQTHPNEVTGSENLSEATEADKVGGLQPPKDNGEDLTNQDALGYQVVEETDGSEKPEAEVAAVAATLNKRPTKRPEKFVVTIEEHPLSVDELPTFTADKDPNVEYQDEFTAQEILQLAYKWLRKNVVFRV